MRKEIQKYIVLFLTMALLFFGLSVVNAEVQKMKNTFLFNNTMVNFFILQFLMYLAIGKVLGLEKFYNEYKKNGTWKINISRLLIIGIPSLILGLFNVLYYIIQIIPIIISGPFIRFNMITNFMQILLGYTIVTSFYKTKE